MALPTDLPEQLQGLTRLAESNKLEMRTVLLRVMTDLYLSKSHHTPDEARQYEAIFLGLLPHLDSEEARANIVAKLARSPIAPEGVLEALIAGGGAPAVEILEQSNVLSRKTLLRAAMQGDPAKARAIAGRIDLDDAVAGEELVEAGAEMAAAFHHDAARAGDVDAVHLEHDGFQQLPPQ